MTPLDDGDDEPDLSLGKGFGSYLRTRLQLVSIETQEALLHLKEKLVPLVAVLVCAIVLYLLVIATLVSFLGKLLSLWSEHPLLGWELPGFIVAILHLIVLMRMKKKLSQVNDTPLFEYSRAELERDREWIQEHTPKKKS